MSLVDIRSAKESDAEALTRIYNHYVETSAITFDIGEKTVAERREWLAHYRPSGRHRLLVAARADEILGYASSSQFRVKAAYDTSIETSIYLAPGHGGDGLGTRLYGALFEALSGEDVHRAYAGITLPNEASVALHVRFGFEEIGVYREVGRKLGRYWDVLWLEKRLG